jgi:D-alanyl-D-alanine carboxypeptidase
MGKIGKFLLAIFILVLVIGGSLIAIRPYLMASGEQRDILSPIPKFLTLLSNSQVSTLNLWFPLLEDTLSSNLSEPEVKGKSVLLYDLTTKKVLYSKNPKERVPMASLTKIMTAIIALENKRTDDRYVVSGADLVGEDAMGLTQGEVLTLSELLYGLVLHSGNDAAETLANSYPTGRAGFIKAMNDKAKTLGLTNTNFTNPTGLEGDGEQYTTTYDLLVITKFALDNFPLFNKVASTFQYTIEETSGHKAYFLENETNLLSSYPGVKGVKTGYTPEAGLCLVTYLDYGGHKIIGILLNSDNRRGEMKELLDYGLKSQGITPPLHD